MKFLYYSNLKKSAQKAFNKGNGKHGKYVVDDGCIATIDKNGRANLFVKIVKNNKPDIIAT